MAYTIFMLCAASALAAAVLLLKAWRRTRLRMLLWSGACFVGLTATNVLLMFDKIVFTTVDLTPLRLSIGLLSVLLLVVGLMLEGD